MTPIRRAPRTVSAAWQASEPIETGRPVCASSSARSRWLAPCPSQNVSAEMPSTRASGSHDITLSTASICASAISAISREKSSSLRSGMFGMRMREM
ncbi:MAG: hypothetical protein KatS3mg118_3611 [Paracoccaceae bacterium]|nr:MAG: hypothetical protein KatS3mg118_3611 [Paracoccaceae bacterium]